MKNIISIFLFLFLFISVSCVRAAEFDSSIDAGIRKDYHVEDIDLPALPKAAPSDNTTVKSVPEIKQTTVPNYVHTGKTYTVKGGTKVVLISKSSFSDWSARGSKVSFSSQNGIVAKDGTIIPAGTVFRGTIVNTHRPQITGNGGLVELKIDEIDYNGIPSYIETKLSAANYKKVYRSDIKGERRYWKNFSKAMNPGKKVFNATRTCASVMAPIPVINILSIVPILGGSVVYIANLTVAPVIAIFTKGGSVSIPAGTQFQIKFSKNTEING